MEQPIDSDINKLQGGLLDLRQMVCYLPDETTNAQNFQNGFFQ